MAEHTLVATATFGVETIVRHELAKLGYDARVSQPGRVAFVGGDPAIREANLWLRCAERVLIRVAEGPAADFDALFELARDAPWAEWIPADGAFPVRGRSHKSQLTSVPACQRTVKKAIVDSLRAAHGVETLPESAAEYAIEVVLLDDRATLLLDTTGIGLHKRGYRRLVGEAPLRETLAAAMLDLSRWTPDRPLWDPFCGSGTIAIEAALIGRGLPPGLNRRFACENWPRLAGDAWSELRDAARRRSSPSLPERIQATDISEEALSLARYHAAQAGVADDIHFQQRPFEEISSKRDFGCLVTNPPYGERIGERAEIAQLYEAMPRVLRRLKTWSHYILSARDDFERLLGQPAAKRRKLYNGRLECTLYQYHGPRPGRPKEQAAKATQASPNELTGKSPAATTDGVLPDGAAADGMLPDGTLVDGALVDGSGGDRAEPRPRQAFGGLKPEAVRQSEEFANRLRKTARHLRRWPTKRGVTCYRLYDRDIPEVPLVVDRYEDALHVTEYERPHERTPAEHADWLDLLARTAAETLEVDRRAVYLKHRERQRGEKQHARVAESRATRTVHEGGLKFLVNLSDYVDTGLFLDHRVTRERFRDEARGKRVLNLFAYTGAFTVYAVDGGAVSTTTVDLSANYLDWAQENLRLNGFNASEAHALVRADARSFVGELPREPLFDLAIVDPPTFSNSKRLDDDWETQRDAVPLLNALRACLSDGGVVYFSTNFRRFKFDEAALDGYAVREISKQTVPEDFRNKRIHRCWRLVAG